MPELILRPFQQEDLDTLTENDYRALVANAPGTGKTILVLSCLSRDAFRLLPAIVVCPASVTHNWKKEARTWVPGLRCHVVDDTTTPIKHDAYDIIILSWSLLPSRWKELLRLKPQLIVGDEIHYAKNEDALRTQAIHTLCTHTKHLLLLSGTPIINDTEELDTINGLFGKKPPIMVRRLLEDVAKDIPPKSRAIVNIELPPRIAARYKSAAHDFSAWLEREMESRLKQGNVDAAVTRALAAEALIKIGYLRRILALGKVYAAADFAVRLIRSGEPVVLFAEHQAVISRLLRCFRRQRISCVRIDGGTPPKERFKCVDSFQRNTIPVFIGSKAAKEGITLTAARHMIFVERYWTSAEEEQAEDRIRRIGQKYPTKIWFMHAPGTVDDRISAIIERKRRIVRNAIGSASIEETPEELVRELLLKWSEHVGAPLAEVVELGLTAPLPPLPAPSDVFQIRFFEPRWQPSVALQWCKMLGYTPTKTTRLSDGFSFTVQSPDKFVSGTFRLFRVAQDVSMYTGKRRPA